MTDTTSYHPPRQDAPKPTGQPLEIDLVYNVRPCGTCKFFWPDVPSQQPYGPYPAYDFLSNTPETHAPRGNPTTFDWVRGRTRPECFPNPEIMDGCRKAPIMTIGINPNLTAFAPGRTGTSWCYPNFSSDDGTDEWTKFAYYYRYRSVYQECFELKFVEEFLLPEPRVVAPRAGVITAAIRASAAPGYNIHVRYDGDKTDTVIPLDRETGTPRWVLLFDPHAPNNRFNAGDTIAARLDVPAGKETEVLQQQVGYYEQFVPVLTEFEGVIRKEHPHAKLMMGEDVCQLDMVACASPHWNPLFLGGTRASEQTVIDNCVVTNAWAMKQLVQTKPTVLYLVGESTWDMFVSAFGALVKRDVPLSTRPADGAFTLLRETTDPKHPACLEFETTIGGRHYELRTRIVITPHFSYNTNFTPQFRLSPDDWKAMQANEPAVASLLQHDRRITYTPGLLPADYAQFTVARQSDVQPVLDAVEKLSGSAAATLRAGFYDAHGMMAFVLRELYEKKELQYGRVAGKDIDALQRTDGPCRFCVNDRWTFPLGCPYGKPEEPPPPAGWLESVAKALVAAGHPHHHTRSTS